MMLVSLVNGALLQAQYNLTNKLLVNNFRKRLIQHINVILKLNGIEQELILKPLNFNIKDENHVNTTSKPIVKEIENDENEDTSIIK